MISKSYMKTLENYLKWNCGNGMGIFQFNQNDNALTAEEIMFNWESKGIDFPSECKNPIDLVKYIQGKKWRDWHIAEWTRGLKERIIFPHELKDTLGIQKSELDKLTKNTYNI